MRSLQFKKIFVFAAILFALFFSGVAQTETLARIELEGLENISPQTVRDIIKIKDGESFSYDDIMKTIDVFQKWGVFESAEVSFQNTADGTIVTFKLKEANVVASIDIDGNYPFVENKVRKYLTLRPGEIYNDAKLLEQTEKIKAFYAREGYLGTEVYYSEDNMPEWGGSLITFRINRGDCLRIRWIDVEGNHAFPNGRFVSIINPLLQFSEKRLSESIRKIKELYQNSGYPKVRVKVEGKNVDLKAKRVDLKLKVDEGPYVKLKFKGNFRIGKKTLKKTVTILKEGSTDQYEIETSIEELKSLFSYTGFPNADIKAKRTDLKDGAIQIEFDIDQGREQKIKFIRFFGNDGVSSGHLSASMRNKKMSYDRSGAYDPEEVKNDNEAIIRAMKRKGFLEAQIDEWNIAPTKQGFALDVNIPITHGPQTLTGEVSFNGNNSFTPVALLKELKARPGKPFDEPGVEEEKARLLTFYNDNGFPYVEINPSWSVDKNTQLASIHYDIREGSFVKIGKVLIVGDVLTSQKAIKKAMDIHEGDAYSYKKIAESQLNIRRLGALAAVNIETLGLTEKESVVHLKVRVEEQKPFQVDLAASYSTYDGITGQLAFSNLNAFGWAKTNSFRLTAGQKLSRAEIGWFDPRFLSSSFEMTSNGWLQYQKRPSYAYTQMAGSLGWLRRLRKFNFFFRYELDRNYFVQGDSVAADSESLRDSTISRISISANYDSRDSFSDPKKGFFTLGGVDIFDEIKGKHANFVKFYWQGENEVTGLSRITLSTALRFSRIQTIGSNVSVPTNELLFMGGKDSVRGFAEDALGPVDVNGKATGARLRWILNEELRFRITRTIVLAAFYDMGSLTNTFSAIDWYNIRRAFGLGFRYITPVGPVRLDYGFKLDRRGNESRGAINFTFGYVF